MKVRATKMYKKLNVEDKELKRIPKVGEEFEVTEERFKELTGENRFKEIFVEKVVAVKEDKKENKKTSTKRNKK